MVYVLKTNEDLEEVRKLNDKNNVNSTTHKTSGFNPDAGLE